MAFDLGGHRFFSDDSEVLQAIQTLLKDELLPVTRRSRIYLAGQYFDYPLNPRQALTTLGPRVSLRILFDYALGHLKALSKRSAEKTFEDWVLSRFGRTLYRLFFKPYTEKVWGIEASELSAHWSRERIGLLHLFHALARGIVPAKRSQPKTYATTFLYPRGGIGRIAECLAEQAKRAGGEIICGVEIHKIERKGPYLQSVRGIDAEGRQSKWSAHQIVSTIPIPEWASLLDPPPNDLIQNAAKQLMYRHMIFVYLILEGDRVSRDTWVYVPDERFHICRIHEPKNWSRALAPGDKTSLCLELFSSLHNGLWLEADESILGLVIEELEALGILDTSRVLDSRVLRVPYTHPVYRLGYEHHVQVTQEFAARELRNFHLLGRTGAFQYKNMDQVMADGFRLAKSLDQAFRAASLHPSEGLSHEPHGIRHLR
jgi:protoporphyrinogen oxidase